MVLVIIGTTIFAIYFATLIGAVIREQRKDAARKAKHRKIYY
jgi:hypothetical protein